MIHWFSAVKPNRWFNLVLFGFLALAIFYSMIIPLFEGPDEDDHFRYVKSIADSHTLPFQRFEAGGGEAGHQGWQPPVYYALAALLISPIDTSDFSDHLIRNQYATVVGDPACCGRNLYYHYGNENFPFMRTTLAVHLVRLLSVLFGAITVTATYAMLKSLVGEWHMALAAAAIVGFNPSFLFASALVSNDTALAALSSLTLLAWVKLIKREIAFNLRSAAMLGVLISLATLTKTTALALAPLTLILFAFLVWERRDYRLLLRTICAFLVAFLLLTGWWFVRNQMLYGDPLAARLVATSALFPRAGDLTMAEFFQISLPQFWTTFWGGPTPSDFSQVILVALALFTALAVVGTVLYTTRLMQTQSRIAFCFLLTWLVILLIGLIQFIRTTQGGDQGRYLFPAISVFGLLFVLGLNQITRHKLPQLNILLIICSFIIAVVVPFAYTLPAYARPPLVTASDQARLAGAARTNFGNQMELLAPELDAHSHKPGESLRVTLYWRALARMSESYRVYVHLIGLNDTSAGGVDVIPARGAFPTLYWNPGDALRDTFDLPISTNAMPGKYSVEVGLYPIGNPSEHLATSGGDDRVVIGFIKIEPRESLVYAPATPTNALFANQIELLGYDTSLSQGQRHLSLYWRARTPPIADYTVFVHVLDAGGKIIAQVDREPQGGQYPTSIWDAGEQVRDDYVFDITAPVVRIEVGLYRADSGERLPVVLNGQPSDHIQVNLGANP